MKNRLGACFYAVILICLLFVPGITFPQATWTQKAAMGGAARMGAVGFSIGTKGYIGTGGVLNVQDFNDFWEWDQSANTWMQKANFGGAARAGAVGFSIGAKGYIGTGVAIGNTFFSDFWEYDPAANNWTQKTAFGGGVRTFAVGFSIGTKGYIGTGGNSPSNQYSAANDFWEYDPISNSWMQKAAFPGAARILATGFATATHGYIGTGKKGGLNFYYKDFYEYNPATNSWLQRADYGGNTRAECTGFSIGNYGYLGIGTAWLGSSAISSIWRFDPGANSWTQVTNYGPGAREMAASFTIGCYGYIGTGFVNDLNATVSNDLWEFSDPANSTCSVIPLMISVSHTDVSCYGSCNGSVMAIPLSGTPPYIYIWSSGQVTASDTGLCAGTYIVTVTDSAGSTATDSVVVSQPLQLMVSYTSSASGCTANSGTASAFASGGFSPYTYSWSNGATGFFIDSLAPGNYTVTVTDSNGCTQLQSVNIGMTANAAASAAAVPGSIAPGESTQLTAGGGVSYLWIPPGGLDCDTCAVTAASPDTTTTYCVMATDSNGCTDSACVTVRVDHPCGSIYIPNAFSPNGDGQNDTLYIRGSCIKELTFSIYDRWGQKVFETDNAGRGWNGTFNGSPMNSAAFVFYLRVIFDRGEEIIRKGSVSIVR